MNLIKYIFKGNRLLFYSIISLIFTIIISIICDKNFLEVCYVVYFIILILLFIVRVSDDIFDYEEDKKRKEQYLIKRNLIYFNISLITLFIILNILFLKSYGVISILLIIYIFIQNKIDFLKIIYLPMVSIYYIMYFDKVNYNKILMLTYLIFSTIASIIYYVIKKKKLLYGER